MVRSIAVFSGKGGVGKTTIAASLAQHSGRVLLDADPQCSAADWADAREGEEPHVIATPLVRTPRALAQYPQAVVDTPGALVANVQPLLKAVDLIVVVTGDKQLDLNALPGTVEVAQQAGPPVVLVLSRVHPQTNPEPTFSLLETLGVTVCPVVVRERSAHHRAFAEGRTAVEYEPQGAAANEIRDLWSWLQEFAQ